MPHDLRLVALAWTGWLLIGVAVFSGFIPGYAGTATFWFAIIAYLLIGAAAVHKVGLRSQRLLLWPYDVHQRWNRSNQ